MRRLRSVDRYLLEALRRVYRGFALPSRGSQKRQLLQRNGEPLGAKSRTSSQLGGRDAAFFHEIKNWHKEQFVRIGSQGRPSHGITDRKQRETKAQRGINEAKRQYAQTLRGLGRPAGEVSTMLDIAPRTLSRTTERNGRPELEADAPDIAIRVSSQLGPSELTFEGTSKQLLLLALSNDGRHPVDVRVEGPANRARPLVCATDVEPGTGTVVRMVLRNSGSHRIRLLPTFTGLHLVNVGLRAVRGRGVSKTPPLR